jgi:proline iminopeptidase
MSLYPEIAPYDHGFMEVEGNLIYWEVCGNPNGKPAVALHGGPGSGCSPWARRLFDPALYRIILFDQRNCGRSLPPASSIETSLVNNTTWSLVGDLENLREMLGIDQWLVLGGSWGSTLGLAYAETHPDRVSELILFGIGTGRYSELDWLFRGGLAIFFPEEWNDLMMLVPAGEQGTDVVEAYSRLLHDPNPLIRRQAATAWCTWESATPAWPPTKGLMSRFQDPDYAYAFARLVTHFIRHNVWLEDGQLLRNADVLSDIPGVIVNGRFDLQGPIGNAWELHRVWPKAELVIVENAGHSAGHPGISDELVRATDRFSS